MVLGYLLLILMWLAITGVRYVELDATVLPRKDAIREIVLGASAALETEKPAAQAAS